MLINFQATGQAVLEKEISSDFAKKWTKKNPRKSKIHWTMTIWTNLVETRPRYFPTKFEVDVANDFWEVENVNCWWTDGQQMDMPNIPIPTPVLCDIVSDLSFCFCICSVVFFLFNCPISPNYSLTFLIYHWHFPQFLILNVMREGYI